MNIIVKIKDNYGSPTIYPVCPKAEMFAAIAKTKTLTMDTINLVRALGYKVIVQEQKHHFAEVN